MVKRDVLADFGIKGDEVEEELQASLAGLSGEEL